jgi:hypothetical protein
MLPKERGMKENIIGIRKVKTIYSMDDNQITPEFIESMVDKIISKLTSKLEVLDISLDYIAAALIDDATAMDIKSRQRRRGRLEESNEEQSAK